MTEKQPLDPAALVLEHVRGSRSDRYCQICWTQGGKWPCLPYRLADALAAEQAKVQRVRTLRRYVIEAWSPNEASPVYAVDADELDSALSADGVADQSQR